MKFETHLMSIRKGERNAELVRLMLRGLGEGMQPQDVCDRIHSVHPDMTEAELRHAMATAESHKTDRIFTGAQIRIRNASAAAKVADEEERTFVQRMVESGAGAEFSDLIACSPITITDATPREQAMAYCATVFPDDRHLTFTATEESKFHKRTYDTLRSPSQIFRDIADGGIIPNYAIANQFTGMPDEETNSFANMRTLATRRLALIEFDGMPLADQVRFWTAAIDRREFGDRLRTLVFSGTKSIHALLRVDSAEIVGGNPDGTAIYSDDPEYKWKIEREKLSRITEHADDASYRADRACKDPTRLTRFAGALRVRKDGAKAVQRLLWCAEPKIADDIPLHPYYNVKKTYLVEGYGLDGKYYSL